uniref:Retrotransposon-related protein n=1 Tax=Tanacetum cinerariifolium TaxID=118510 RepID=A0A6L2NF18_TANCI|nr:retrotransposon-related protein [Tanacetum cinerariifolium]
MNEIINFSWSIICSSSLFLKEFARAIVVQLTADAAQKQVQQQAEAFHAQFEALRVELQATKGLLLGMGEAVIREFAAGEDEAVENGDISIINSTHNFVRPDVVEWMRLPLQATKAFKVYIGNGETLLCENVCSRVSLHMHGLVMKIDLYVLPMQGPDVLLGIQWLQKLGKVTHDYAQQIMEFTLLDTKYTLKGDESLRMKKISLHQMQSLLKTEDVYGVYECHGFATSDEGGHETSTVSTNSGPPELEQLLAWLDSLFQKDSSYRFCVYYHALNAATIKDKFPIPTTDKMFNELGGASIFTKLDLRAGYHQIQRSKCVFGARALTYLRHIISARGVEMDLKNILAVRDWPVPKTQWQVRRFFGTREEGYHGMMMMMMMMVLLVDIAWIEYIRAMVTNCPQKWVRYLPWAEYYYNYSYHNSIKMSPFQALYGRLPLSVILYLPGSLKVATVDDLLVECDGLLRPYKVEARVGKVAYPVWHFLRQERYTQSFMYPFLRPSSVTAASLVMKILVQGIGGSLEDATWE